MTVTLGSRDISQLQKTLEAILTPAASPSPEEWGKAVMLEVSRLLRADQALFALPLDTTVHITGIGERTAEAARQYESDYWRTDFLLGQRRKQLGLEVHHQSQLYKDGETKHDVLFNEWCIPNKLLDTLGMAVEIPGAPIPAGVNVYHDGGSKPFGERGQTLMHLLLPAFKASVRSFGELARAKESLSEMIDKMANGACVIGDSGEILHSNSALERLYEAEVDKMPLRSAISRIGSNIRAVSRNATNANTGYGSMIERITTKSNTYEIRGTRLPLPGIFPTAVAFIVVEAAQRRGDVLITMKEKFHLTQREIEVAVLLSKRLRAAEVASRLGISTHTVRHHTEKIFQKTGVSSRHVIADLFERLDN